MAVILSYSGIAFRTASWAVHIACDNILENVQSLGSDIILAFNGRLSVNCWCWSLKTRQLHISWPGGTDIFCIASYLHPLNYLLGCSQRHQFT